MLTNSQLIQVAGVARTLPADAARRVLVHNPMDTNSQRFVLAYGIEKEPSIQAVRLARIMLGMTADGGDPHARGGYWQEGGSALLAACLIRYGSLGRIYNALPDTLEVARALGEVEDEAFSLSAAFRNSVARDRRLAANLTVILTLNLTGWADPVVRERTDTGDFSIGDLGMQGDIVVFTCPSLMESVFGNYLAACLWRVKTSLQAQGASDALVQVVL